MEPVQIGGFRAVLQDVVELKEAPRGVVEHAIQHHPDAAGVGRVQQLAQRRVAAQHRIHLEVVVGVIAMVRARAEDRVEIDGVDPQVGQVIQPLDHAQQIAALVGVAGGRGAPRLQVGRLGHVVRLGKAIGRDLIEDSVPNPVGCLNRGHRMTPVLIGYPPAYAGWLECRRESEKACRLVSTQLVAQAGRHKDDAAGTHLAKRLAQANATLALDDVVLVFVGMISSVCPPGATSITRSTCKFGGPSCSSSITQRMVTPGAASPKTCAGTSV